MKKLLSVLQVSALMLVSINAFPMDWLKMKNWDKRMEKLAQKGDEIAIDLEEQQLQLQLRSATGKEAEIIRKKLSKINFYRVMD